MDLLVDGPDAAPTLVLAHGAGAAMDSPGMTDVTARIAARGVRVVRFEFAYMASRRLGTRKPPPRADTLLEEYRAVLAEVGGRPAIGGRSMGGRVASMVAAEAFSAGAVTGLVCLSYPWHPPARPDQPEERHACPPDESRSTTPPASSASSPPRTARALSSLSRPPPSTSSCSTTICRR